MLTFVEPDIDKWNEIVSRPAIQNDHLKNIVSNILKDVIEQGDDAVIKYNKQFDDVDLDDLKIRPEEIENAANLLSEDLRNAIHVARENILKFHLNQKENLKPLHTSPGIKCWRKSVAIQKVGLYIPGGTAPLFSTLLMLAIPAQIAGCKEIIVCTPPRKDGSIDASILYVANILGLDKIFKTGGVQAIGAMAYGTHTIPKVYKIFGPGNQYVTAAKQMVNSTGVAIDMPAGPSEVAVYADDTSFPAFVASDLLSQAEHGVDSQVLLVASAQKIVDEVAVEITKQINSLSRKEIVVKCLEKSHFVILKDVDNAFALLNEYAPEHLIIASSNEDLQNKVVNAGSVFLGHYTPESMGDYASGTNHTLPTNGFAKAYSGVSLDSFIKKITFQSATKKGIKNIGNTVELMASAEGLDAHKNAITIRLKSLNNL